MQVYVARVDIRDREWYVSLDEKHWFWTGKDPLGHDIYDQLKPIFDNKELLFLISYPRVHLELDGATFLTVG